jgi:hypothetical protein
MIHVPVLVTSASKMLSIVTVARIKTVMIQPRPMIVEVAVVKEAVVVNHRAKTKTVMI